MSGTHTHNGIVIIGSGMAGVTLAREIRKLAAGIPVTLITADDGSVYSKPMLSNALAQNKSPDALVQKSAGAFAAEMNVTVKAHTYVRAIDRAAKQVRVEGPDGGTQVPYGQLVLALGARARDYQVEGSGAAPLFSVNTLDDYTHWREALSADARVLIVGAGLIGLEFANDLSITGHAVEVVDPAPWALGRLLPEALAREMEAAFSGIGVKMHMGRAVTGMIPADGGGWIARLDDGRRIAFDVALSAIGLVPHTQLAKDAGLEVAQGIRVDAWLRTSDRDIYALGDCAQTEAGVLPFVLPLMAQARALAGTLAGRPEPLRLPALPVTVKTPALACVVCPPRPGQTGQWRVEGQGPDRKALFLNENGDVLGFALTGAETKARQVLAKDVPDLLAA